MSCIFCHQLKEEEILLQTKHFKLVFDIDPFNDGHVLIISREHYMNLLELPDDAVLELISLEKMLIHLFEQHFDADGTTVLQNNGGVMDSNTHFHVHITPRYKDDGFWDNVSPVRHALNIEQLAELIKSSQ